MLQSKTQILQHQDLCKQSKAFDNAKLRAGELKDLSYIKSYHAIRGKIKQERTTDVLEHFLHLLLASLAVNGHPQHHILKQGTHKRIENKNQTKSVTGTGIKLKNRNRSGIQAQGDRLKREERILVPGTL